MLRRGEGSWLPGHWGLPKRNCKNSKNKMECVLLAIMTNYPQAAERLQSFSYMPQAIVFEFKFSRAKKATVTYFKTVQSG